MDEPFVLDSSQNTSTEELPAGQPLAKRYRLVPPSSPCEAPEGQEQPPQQPAQHPSTENQDLQIPENLMTHARQNFARHHGKELDEVKIEDVIKSKEGVVHWVVKTTPLLAQSPQSQVFARQLEKLPVL